MSEPTHQVTYKYDVFVIYAGCDEETAKHVVHGLESEENLKCQAQWKEEAFRPGNPVVGGIVKNMRKSKLTLLILTKDSLDSSWVTLETILAVEHSIQRGELTLRLLLYDVQEKDIGFLKKGLLKDIPDITVNFNKENWAKTLAKSLNEPIHLPDLLPVGSLAHGQVFSHFTGYLVYLLPKLEEIIIATEPYKQNPDNVSMKLLMLLPGSCDLPNTLDTQDLESGITISTEKHLQFQAHHAGKRRPLDPPLYKVTKGTEVYYFIADLPNVLKSMFSMSSKELAKVDLRYQVARFYYTMNEVLNHAENHETADKVTLVPYNDAVDCKAEVVYQAVRDDVMFQRTRNARPAIKSTPQRFSSQEEQSYENDILIVVGEDDKDQRYANEILEFMKNNDKKVALQQKYHFEGLDKARWVVFIISRSSMSENKEVALKCVSVLVDSINGNLLRALPVLVDVEPRELPQMIKWVTIVTVSESRYKDRLLHTVNGWNISVEERLPAGDVITGLAWGYVINYLTVTLLGQTENKRNFTERIQDLLKEKKLSCGCINRVFLLVPRSCSAQPDVKQEANRGCDKGPVQRVGSLEPIVVNKREYRFHMFKYTDPDSGESVCFLCEYSTPINCLHEMANSYSFAGLHKAEMHKQVEEFVQLFPTIVNRQAVKDRLGDVSNMVQLVFFDDEKESLLSALKSQIKFNEVLQADLVFAD